MAKEEFTLRNIRSFWSKVQKSEGCWLWTACVGLDGYGRIRIDSKQVTAHRFSWRLHYSAIPEGLCVCHRCDTPSCVNPEHLFLGTVKDNTRDKVSKGRQAIGERIGIAKLTSAEVLKIRELLASGARTHASIASEFGIARNNVTAIKAGRSWKHI